MLICFAKRRSCLRLGNEENAGELVDDALPVYGSGGMNIFSTTDRVMLVPQTGARVQLLATFYNGATAKDYVLTTTLALGEAGKQITYQLVIDLDKNYMGLAVPSVPEEGTSQWNYSYTGAAQTFTAPADERRQWCLYTVFCRRRRLLWWRKWYTSDVL